MGNLLSGAAKGAGAVVLLVALVLLLGRGSAWAWLGFVALCAAAYWQASAQLKQSAAQAELDAQLRALPTRSRR